MKGVVAVPRQGNTKQKIVDEAIRLFASHGYDNVSLRQIADAAGIRSGSIYNHFDSKSDILQHIMDRIVEDVRRSLPTPSRLETLLLTRSPVEVLQLFAFGYPDNALKRQISLYRILFSSQYANTDMRDLLLEDLIGRQVDLLTQVLEELVKLDQIPPCDCASMAGIYVRTFLAITLEATLDPPPEELAVFQRQAADFLCTLIIGSPPTAAKPALAEPPQQV